MCRKLKITNEDANLFLLFAVTEGRDDENMDIYIQSDSGKKHFLVQKKFNYFTYQMLKSGTSIADIGRVKARRGRTHKRTEHCLNHISKVAENYIRYACIA